MDDLIIIEKLRRRINSTLESIQVTMMTGGLTIWKNTSIYLDRHKPIK